MCTKGSDHRFTPSKLQADSIWRKYFGKSPKPKAKRKKRVKKCLWDLFGQFAVCKHRIWGKDILHLAGS